MKFKVGDLVVRVPEDQCQAKSKYIGLYKTHTITEIKPFTHRGIDVNNPRSYFYMLEEVDTGLIHSAWEVQLVPDKLYNSPLLKALR